MKVHECISLWTFTALRTLDWMEIMRGDRREQRLRLVRAFAEFHDDVHDYRIKMLE